MKGWRVALRLAAREASRHKARTLLVALLVGLPVGGIVFGASLVRSITPTEAQQRAWTHGGADVVVSTGLEPRAAQATIDRLIVAYGADAVVGSHLDETVYNGEGGTVRSIEFRDLPISDPLTRGVRVLTQGRAPATPDEVAVSPAVLRDAGTSLGGKLELIHPRRALQITGVVIDPGALGAPVGLAATEIILEGPDPATFAHIDLPAGVQPSVLGPVLGRDWAVNTGVYATEDLGHRVSVATVPGGVGLVVAAIVAAAALAIGARRQLRILGLLAASGASPDQLRGVMTAAGAVIGSVGAALGVAIAACALAASAPFVDNWAGHLTDGVRVSIGDIALAAILGIVAATGAAWFPAFASARIPVLSSLAGRRPLGRVPRWLPFTAVVVMVLGTALMAGGAAMEGLWSFVLAGAIAVVLGATAIAPRVVAGLEPLASRFHGPARLAVRSLVRHRTRAAAVVAAVMAAASLTMAGSVFAMSTDAQAATVLAEGMGGYVQSDDQVVIEDWDASDAVVGSVLSEVEQIIPEAVSARRSIPFVPAGEEEDHSGWVYAELSAPAMRAAFGEDAVAGGRLQFNIRTSLATGDLLSAIAAPAAAAAALSDADIVVFAPKDGGRARASLVMQVGAGESRRRRITARVLPTDRPDLFATAVMAPERAAALGFDARDEEVVVRAPSALTGAQRHALDRLSQELLDAEQSQIETGLGGVGVYVRYLPTLPSSTGTRAVFLALSLVFTLGVVALGLALAAADGRSERALLGALGAPPAANRRISVVQSVITAALGGLLAVPLGFGPPALVVQITDGNIVFPWTTAVGLVVVVPLLVGLVTSAVSRLSGARQIPVALVAAD